MADQGSRDGEITAQWKSMLAHRDGEVRAIAAGCFKHHVLRSLFPFSSHEAVMFTTKFPFPYDWDLPCTRHNRGIYEVVVVQRVLFEGGIEECAGRNAAMIDHILKARG